LLAEQFKLQWAWYHTTRCLSRQIRDTGQLQPGLIDTENILPFFASEERYQFANGEIPLGDFGKPEDMANMAAFLV